MKNISIILAVVLLLSVGIAFAQDSVAQNAKGKMPGNGQRAALNQSTQSQSAVASQTAANSTPSQGVIKSETCDGTGRGYGDGSKPQPKDGTGFGAKAQKRQHRNAKLGNGQGNSQRKGLGKGAKNGTAQRTRRQLRDGSCGNQSTNTVPTTSESK
ncbi:MAG: hypothetical protein CVV41_09360 [Candidatus Riflebacteria bacterium HGW-Riflebacteria-1]|jgi:hypothetical protein|nr:MAG: hypothetical protein CVV41_09360 [Candidatus Riflebacteria bacterium HGW-Riflebacteria-1]